MGAGWGKTQNQNIFSIHGTQSTNRGLVLRYSGWVRDHIIARGWQGTTQLYLIIAG
jgi:hypothetical protein